MKILTFVDLHGSKKAMERIKKLSSKVDLIVCAGDLSIFGNKIDELLFELNSIEKKMLIIPGNHEDFSELKKLCKLFDNIDYIDNGMMKLDNYLFFGYGDGGFSTVDETFERLGKKFEKEIKKHKDCKVVLVTHAPPHKTKLDNIHGESCGNKAIRKFIQKNNILLAVSGHLHENSGKEDKLNGCKLINPGAYGRIVDV